MVGARKPRIGLALSGGTLKAAAHIGVIEELERMGIRPDIVAGTSAGSLITALYAHGFSPAAMRQVARRFSLWPLFDYGFPIASSLYNVARYRMNLRRPRRQDRANGLLAGRKLERFVSKQIGRKSAKLPYCITATDLYSGLPVTFTNEVPLIQMGLAQPCTRPAQCVTASCAVPGIFSPVSMDDYLLVDGAFRDYVPVNVLRAAGCEKIIAVNLYRLDEVWYPETVIHVLVRSFEILLRESIDNDLKSQDLVVLEPDLENMTWFSVDQLARCIELGRQVVRAHRAEIERLWT